MSHDLFALDGQRVLVTGGASGLGLGVAEGLCRAGATVAITSRSEKKAEEAARKLGSAAIPLALEVSGAPATVVNDVESALEGTIDVIVHAAGIQHRQPAAEFDLTAWDKVIEVNLSAPFRLSQEVGRRQIQAGRSGSHIFIGSLSTSLSIPNAIAYTASKAGVGGIVRSLSTEWSYRGIRANAIAPGYFRTALTEEVFSDPLRYEEMLARIPMGRFGQPEELAGAAIYLASRASSYTSGQVLYVDGGWTAA